MHTGAKPVFFSDGQFIPYPNLSLPLPLDSTGMRSREHNAQILLYGIDGELAQVWRLMKHFCTLINLATATKRQITKETLLETMASVMYRLLYMSFPSGSTSEMVRLGLLAFSSHIFLQWLDIKLSYRHFHASYRKCLKGMETLNVLPPSIMLWLLMIGAISVFTEADDERLELSLRRYILLCEGEPWSRVRVILKRFLWIDCLHDKQGKAIINSLWS